MSPAVEATFTMLPPFSSRYGRAAWHIRKVPVRLTARMRCQSSNDASMVWANLPMPATLHTVLGTPSWATTSFIDVATESGSLTSVRTAMAWPPAALISSTVSSAPASEMSRAATRPPSPAISWAVACPSPEAAPVTTATRPPNRPPSLMSLRVYVTPRQLFRPALEEIAVETRQLFPRDAGEARHRGELAQLVLDVAAAGLHGELGCPALLHHGHAVGQLLGRTRERHRRDQLTGDERPVTLVDLDHVALVDGQMPGSFGD